MIPSRTSANFCCTHAPLTACARTWELHHGSTICLRIRGACNHENLEKTTKISPWLDLGWLLERCHNCWRGGGSPGFLEGSCHHQPDRSGTLGLVDHDRPDLHRGQRRSIQPVCGGLPAWIETFPACGTDCHLYRSDWLYHGHLDLDARYRSPGSFLAFDGFLEPTLPALGSDYVRDTLSRGVVAGNPAHLCEFGVVACTLPKISREDVAGPPLRTLPGDCRLGLINAAPVLLGGALWCAESPTDLVPAGCLRAVHHFGRGQRYGTDSIRLDASSPADQSCQRG